MRTTPRLLLLLLAVGLLAACADPGGVGGPGSPDSPTDSSVEPTTAAPTTPPATSDATTSSPGTAASVAADLTITVQAGPDAEPETFTLTCDPPGGSYSDPAAGCEFLSTVEEDAFEPVPADVVCTQIYGGPQTASITGTWQGSQINAAFSRVNGCEIGRWDALEPLIGPGGA